jgi:hypothetical protein
MSQAHSVAQEFCLAREGASRCGPGPHKLAQVPRSTHTGVPAVSTSPAPVSAVPQTGCLMWGVTGA